MRDKREATISVIFHIRKFESYEEDGETAMGELSTERSRDFNQIDNALRFIKTELEEAISQERIYQFSLELTLNK